MTHHEPDPRPDQHAAAETDARERFKVEKLQKCWYVLRRNDLRPRQWDIDSPGFPDRAAATAEKVRREGKEATP
jgi:hypothetical protein